MGIQELTGERSAASTLIIISVSFFLTACAQNPMFDNLGLKVAGSGFTEGGGEIVGFVGDDILLDNLDPKDISRINVDDEKLQDDEAFNCEPMNGSYDRRADFNADGSVDDLDREILKAHWGSDNEMVDINADGVVDGDDLSILLLSWGESKEFKTYAREDLDQSGAVDRIDLKILQTFWGTDEKLADLNSDGVVDGYDLGQLLAAWSPEVKMNPEDSISKVERDPC